MKIERRPANQMSLEAFADKHELIMEIGERTRTDLHASIKFETNRFYAGFKDTEVKDSNVLCGKHGNGATEDEAMRDYAQEISGKLLVVCAWDKELRREIWTPELYHLTSKTSAETKGDAGG